MAETLTEWTIAAETTEWLGPVAVSADGVPVGNFELTLTGPGERPVTWVAPTVIGSGKGLLVGAESAWPLAPTKVYTLWVRYADVPEIPVQRCGTVKVT